MCGVLLCSLQTSRASHTARHCIGSDANWAFHCSVQQSCVFEGQDHQSTILPTHPLPPWRWPVLRARFHPMFKTLHAKQHYLTWTLSSLLYCCMHVARWLLFVNGKNKQKLIILCLLYWSFAVSFPQSPPFAAKSQYTGQTHILEHTIFPLHVWPFSCGLFNLSKS